MVEGERRLPLIRVSSGLNHWEAVIVAYVFTGHATPISRLCEVEKE